MAMSIKDYMLSLRTSQSLEVLSSHPDLGQKSVAYSKFSSTMARMYGANR